MCMTKLCTAALKDKLQQQITLLKTLKITKKPNQNIGLHFREGNRIPETKNYSIKTNKKGKK